MYQRSVFNHLIRNDPLAYADLILNREPKAYLKTSQDTSLLIKISVIHTAGRTIFYLIILLVCSFGRFFLLS